MMVNEGYHKKLKKILEFCKIEELNNSQFIVIPFVLRDLFFQYYCHK